MPSQPLLITTVTIGSRSSDAVASSWHVIWKQPSPSMQTTVASGRAAFAPIAAGTPYPIVPRPPDVMNDRGSSQTRYCIAHIWCWPTPVVQIDVLVEPGGRVAQRLDRASAASAARRPSRTGTGTARATPRAGAARARASSAPSARSDFTSRRELCRARASAARRRGSRRGGSSPPPPRRCRSGSPSRPARTPTPFR